MRREAAREYVRGALWVLPTAAIVLALVAGSVLSSITIAPDSRLAPLVFQGTADDARNLLVSIASTMVTVIALVLGLTVVALQLASTQFSPRLLRSFLRDLPNQLTLSSFVATFAYSTAGLYTVGVSRGERTSEYPRLAVSGALLLIFVSMLMLVFFVHHLAHSIQVDQVMLSVEKDTLRVVRHLPTVGDFGPPLERPGWAVPLTARRSGYVQTLHLEELVQVAARHDVVVALVPMIGEHVVAGAPIAWVWRPGQGGALDAAGVELTDVARAVAHGVRVGFERTAEQDAAFGVRQLADVASKALSPAINDPYTAVQAVDHLSVVLAALASVPLGHQRLADRAGTTRVHLPGRDWAYFLDLGLGQVRRFGHGEPRVVLALLRVARDVAFLCDEGRCADVRQFVTVLLDDVRRDVAQPVDREALLARGEALMGELVPASGRGRDARGA